MINTKPTILTSNRDIMNIVQSLLWFTMIFGLSQMLVNDPIVYKVTMVTIDNMTV